MCLTGRMMDADEAERSGLVSRVFTSDGFLENVKKVAADVSEKSMVATMMTKEMVNRSYETTLSEGIRFERRSMGNRSDQEGTTTTSVGYLLPMKE